jgi:hypothetical protein
MLVPTTKNTLNIMVYAGEHESHRRLLGQCARGALLSQFEIVTF